MVITIHCIRIEDMVAVLFSDGSLANNIDLRTQVCYVACVADSSILDGADAPTSVIAYTSHKMDRAASNVLYTESFAMSEGLAFGEWMATWFGLAKDLDYKMSDRNVNNREIKLQSIMSEAKSDLPKLLAVSDSKSLYDNATRE